MNRRPNQQSKSLRSEAAEAIASCAAWNIRLAARRITQFYETRMAGCGLSIAQFGLMAQIAALDDDSLGALATRSGLEQSTLSRNLKALEEDGLVEIALTSADQRRRKVWLTEQGAQRLAAALPVWRDTQKEVAARIDIAVAQGLAKDAGEIGTVVPGSAPRTKA